MNNTLEIARFAVEPENAERMLDARRPVMDHLATTYPSFVRSWMVRIDERVWVDYAEWSDRDEAERAAREVMESRVCAGSERRVPLWQARIGSRWRRRNPTEDRSFATSSTPRHTVGCVLGGRWRCGGAMMRCSRRRWTTPSVR